MIVDHLCYSQTGGAAVAALRIHEGLRSRGVDSRYWHAPDLTPRPESTRKAPSSSPSETVGEPDDSRRPLSWPRPPAGRAMGRLVSSLTRTAHDLGVKIRHLRHRPAGFEYFSTGRLRSPTPWPSDQLSGDVLVLHWIGKLVDYPSFFASLPKDRPVVWVLHDMNPFTGGCHFSAGCDRFTTHCGNCPQIAGSGDRDITFQTLRMKRQLYQGLNLHIVSPSRWLSAEAQRSVPFADVASHRVIPYGLETDQFTPVDRQQARRALNLGDDKRIVLFGAASSENRRKGFHCLLNAWSEMPRRDGPRGHVWRGSGTHAAPGTGRDSAFGIHSRSGQAEAGVLGCRPVCAAFLGGQPASDRDGGDVMRDAGGCLFRWWNSRLRPPG